MAMFITGKDCFKANGINIDTAKQSTANDHQSQRAPYRLRAKP